MFCFILYRIPFVGWVSTYLHQGNASPLHFQFDGTWRIWIKRKFQSFAQKVFIINPNIFRSQKKIISSNNFSINYLPSFLWKKITKRNNLKTLHLPVWVTLVFQVILLQEFFQFSFLFFYTYAQTDNHPTFIKLGAWMSTKEWCLKNIMQKKFNSIPNYIVYRFELWSWTFSEPGVIFLTLHMSFLLGLAMCFGWLNDIIDVIEKRMR